MWAESAGAGRGSTFHFTIKAPTAALPAQGRREFIGAQPRLAGPARAGRRRQRHQSARAAPAGGQVGHGARGHRVARGGAALDRRGARRSTSPSSTCTCRRWTGSRWRGRSARERPTLPLVLFSSLGRKEAGDTDGLFSAYLAKPLRQSQLFDTLVTILAHETAPKDAPAAKPRIDAAMASRHPLRILLAEDNVGQPEARAAHPAADGLSRRPRVERHRGRRVGRAPDLRRRADGRADARDGRPRGGAPDQRALGDAASARASSR